MRYPKPTTLLGKSLLKIAQQLNSHCPYKLDVGEVDHEDVRGLRDRDLKPARERIDRRQVNL